MSARVARHIGTVGNFVCCLSLVGTKSRRACARNLNSRAETRVFCANLGSIGSAHSIAPPPGQVRWEREPLCGLSSAARSSQLSARSQKSIASGHLYQFAAGRSESPAVPAPSRLRAPNETRAGASVAGAAALQPNDNGKQWERSSCSDFARVPADAAALHCEPSFCQLSRGGSSLQEVEHVLPQTRRWPEPLGSVAKRRLRGLI